MVDIQYSLLFVMRMAGAIRSRLAHLNLVALIQMNVLDIAVNFMNGFITMIEENGIGDGHNCRSGYLQKFQLITQKRIAWQDFYKMKLTLRLLTLLSFFLLSCYFEIECAQKSCSNDQFEMTLWKDLLNSFETHTESSKHLVKTISERCNNQILGQLAKVLIEQWDIHWSDPIFSRAFLIYKNELIDLRDINEYSVPLIEITINQFGTVDSVEFLTPSENTELQKQISNTLKKYLFRPKFENGRFVSSKLIILFRIEFK
jgi:hypothetical protein